MLRGGRGHRGTGEVAGERTVGGAAWTHGGMAGADDTTAAWSTDYPRGEVVRAWSGWSTAGPGWADSKNPLKLRLGPGGPSGPGGCEEVPPPTAGPRASVLYLKKLGIGFRNHPDHSDHPDHAAILKGFSPRANPDQPWTTRTTPDHLLN